MAGSTLNLRTAVYNMIKYLNVPLCDAVRMVSLTPATAINIHNNKGSIEIGKDADLILFDDNINIKSVVIAGNINDLQTT